MNSSLTLDLDSSPEGKEEDPDDSSLLSPLQKYSETVKKNIDTPQELKIIYVDPEYIKMQKSEIKGSLYRSL